MPARPSAVELLVDLARVLGRRRWYLFGAQAVNVLGRPRMTADVDVTVEIDRDQLRDLVDRLREEGFDLRVTDPEEFVETTSVLPFVHRSSGMPLDIVIAGSGLEAMFLDRTEPRDVGGLIVPVISASDLIVAKILAGRTKDIEDAVGVLRERPEEIDLDGVRDLIAEIERALDQSDLLPTLERIIRDARRKQRAPRRPVRPKRPKG